MPERLWEALKRWPGRFWTDLKASTDASLLGVLRFLGWIYGPIEQRASIGDAFRAALRHRLPAHVGARHALGGITYLLLMMLVVTGVLLSFYYRPSAQEAAHSVQHIVSGVRLGWLIRDVHLWSANLLVVAVIAHLLQVFIDASYKPPRETNWLAGMLLLLVTFAFGVTGYLLPWDQWAYWTVTEQLEHLGRIPLVGGLLVELLRGDPVVSGATLSRFFAWHVILLPWMAMGLLMLHFALVRKHGIAAPAEAPDAPMARTVPFFPDHLLRAFAVSVLVIAVTVTAAVLFPRDVLAEADPARPPATLGATWIMADVIRGLTYRLGAWGMGLFLVASIALALLPVFDRDPERRWRERRVALTLAAVFVLGFVGAWVYGRSLRDDPPRGATPPVTLHQLPAAEPSPAAPEGRP